MGGGLKAIAMNKMVSIDDLMAALADLRARPPEICDALYRMDRDPLNRYARITVE